MLVTSNVMTIQSVPKDHWVDIVLDILDDLKITWPVSTQLQAYMIATCNSINT
jgi:hypothetical protein